MAPVNRASLIIKTHKVLKKHFKPCPPHHDFSLLEQALFAAVLENAPPDAAEQVYAALSKQFFDWNEVRVSTVRELCEVMSPIPDREAAALRLKGILQSVFEAQYSFDLEILKKQNIGVALKKLEKYEGITPFSLAFITQTALGGHSIPMNEGALAALVVLGIVEESDAAKGRVPGLERAIAKNKGIEFGSLLHQLGVAFHANPYASAVRQILLEINPDCKSRLPKRGAKKLEPSAEKPSAEKPSAASNPPESVPADAAKGKRADKKEKPAEKSPTTKPTARKEGKAEKATKPEKKTASKAQKGKPAKKTPAKTKKTAAKKTTPAKIAKRKPR